MKKIKRGLQCFTIGENEKIKYLHLENALNKEDCEYIFVELRCYGLNGVYTLLNIKEFKELYYISQQMDTCEISLYNIIKDCPVYEKDMLSKEIPIKNLTYENLISMLQLKYLLEGVSIINDNEHIGDSRYFDIILKGQINSEKMNTKLSKYTYTKICTCNEIDNYKYILLTNSNQMILSNEIPTNKNIDGLLVKIPELRCYQYIPNVMLRNFNSIDSINIQYLKTNKIKIPDIIEYYDELYLDSIDNIAKYGIYLPANIYFSKLLENKELLEDNKLTSEGYQIDVYTKDCKISTVITQKEMLIDFDKMDEYNQFWFLELINKVIDVKPYY